MATLWCRNYLKKLFQPSRNKVIEGKQPADHVHWNRLSREILQQIVNKLNSFDRLRMSLVCKSWKSVQSISRVPWLILPHEYTLNNNSLSFFDLCEAQVYTVSLPTATWFCGSSSKGWLLMLQLKRGPGQSHPIIFLFNPISGVQLPLPSIGNNRSFQTFLRCPLHIANFVNKIEISSSVDASDCIIASIFFDGNILALCTTKGESWTIFQGIDPEVYSCADILFCRGILHALIYSKKTCEPISSATHTLMVGGHDVIVKLIPADPTASRRRIPLPVDWINPKDEDETKLADWIPEDENNLVWRTRHTGFRAYLVQSEGELLIVHKMMNILNTQIDTIENHGNKLSYPQVLRFEVFKINGDRSRSLGERVLFVTSSSSLSVAARDSNGLKKNSILFLDDYVYGIGNCYSILSRESGVFYLESGRIERSLPAINNSNYSPMSWFPLVNN